MSDLPESITITARTREEHRDDHEIIHGLRNAIKDVADGILVAGLDTEVQALSEVPYSLLPFGESETVRFLANDAFGSHVDGTGSAIPDGFSVFQSSGSNNFPDGSNPAVGTVITVKMTPSSPSIHQIFRYRDEPRELVRSWDRSLATPAWTDWEETATQSWVRTRTLDTDEFGPNSPPGNLPAGHHMMATSTDTGWPTSGGGSLTVHKSTSNRALQIWHEQSGNSFVVWYRLAADSTSWLEWRRLVGDLTADALTATDPPSAWPPGRHTMPATREEQYGWPGGEDGTVVTVRLEPGASPAGPTVQWFYAADHGQSNPSLWWTHRAKQRTWWRYETGTPTGSLSVGNDEWSEWQSDDYPVDDDLEPLHNAERSDSSNDVGFTAAPGDGYLYRVRVDAGSGTRIDRKTALGDAWADLSHIAGATKRGPLEVTGDGMLLAVLAEDGLWKSDTADITTASWTQVQPTTGDAQFLSNGVRVRGSLVLAGEVIRGAPTREDSRYVRLSQDSGDTFTEIRDTWDIDTAIHIHCVGIWEVPDGTLLLWAGHNEGSTIRRVEYAWLSEVDGLNTPWQVLIDELMPMTMDPTPYGMVFGTDDRPGGTYRAEFAGGTDGLHHVTLVDAAPGFNTTTDRVLSTAHGLQYRDIVRFAGDIAPGGIALGRDYSVVDVSADAFGVAEVPGGTQVDITSSGSNVSVSKYEPRVEYLHEIPVWAQGLVYTAQQSAVDPDTGIVAITHWTTLSGGDEGHPAVIVATDGRSAAVVWELLPAAVNDRINEIGFHDGKLIARLNPDATAQEVLVADQPMWSPGRVFYRKDTRLPHSWDDVAAIRMPDGTTVDLYPVDGGGA